MSHDPNPPITNYSEFMTQLIRSMRFLRDELPIIVTNTDVPNIHDTIMAVLRNQYLDSVYFSCPYISDYFVNVMRKTAVKSIFCLIDKAPTDYVQKAMDGFRDLRQHHVEVNIVQRPEQVQRNGKMTKTPFLHQKILVPIYRHPQYGQYTPCAFAGSVNLTANGIKNNDEALIVLKNKDAIIKCLYVIFARAIESQNV